ncbi:YhcH/YjgK/YiaL family protein [Propionivibrio sp.]|uniref:YhcH/YjgK/YiaL family protein n=1 Tax=Propionivibrio sp. TaxID=2212460 RepID=UPI00262EBD7A|nr:YhcH/YjgK/YiaL family protein [Propionivibrio sp.]
MIFGHVNDLESGFAWLPKPLKTAVQHLKDTDFSALPVGNYDLQGKDIYVQVFDATTKPFAETRAEVHRQYIDVQYSCNGNERMGFASETGNNVILENLLESRDLLFYAGMESESTLIMTPGSFVVFFPSDVHRPGCVVEQPASVRKVVIKVRASLLSESH